ncbi:MAG: hypothetical protein ABIH09_05870 [Candidatus Omnitrophota bacterium]
MDNKHYKNMKKGLTCALVAMFCACFVFQDAWAAVDLNRARYDIPVAPPAYGHFAVLDTNTFTIPAHLGDVKYAYNGDSNMVVIHIQDAHCNYYAQRKISDILDYLNKEYGVSVINLEGGVGEYDLGVFTSISGETIRKEVADYFVKQGEINGAEFYAVNNPEKVMLWGVEDKDLYLDNLQVYRDSLKYKPEVDKYLNELTHILNNLKRHIFSPELLKFDIAYGAYKSGNLGFREYLEFLIAKANDAAIDVKSFNNLYLLIQAMEQEDEIDFKKANMERNILIDELKNSLSKHEIAELVSKSVDFKTKKISRKNFYSYLLTKAEEVKIKISRFSELSNYITYVMTYEAVNRFHVMKELDELESKIKEPLYKNDIDQQLTNLSRNLALTKNIFNISLTKTDYEYYLANKDSFGIINYVDFIEKEAPKYKIDARPSASIFMLDDYRGRISGFYEYSFERDKVFIKNLKFHPERENVETAVLMTGGFHTENLCDLFKSKNISYVSIIPKFTSEKGYECPYFDLLAGQTTNIQRMLTSVLAKTSTLQYASRLSSLGKDVWGEREIDSFNAAVYIRELIVRAKQEQGRNIKIVLVRADNRPVEDEEGEVIFGEENAEPELLTVTELLDEIAQPISVPTVPSVPSRGELSPKVREMRDIARASFEVLTTNPVVKTAVPEKFALHKAMNQIEAGKSILVVTAEASAVRDLNEIYGHTGVDLLRDEFGKAFYKFIEQEKDELSDIGVKFTTYYNPYGGRWHYIFTVEEDYNEQAFEKFLNKLLESSLALAREEAEKSGLKETKVFNVIMSASEPSAKDINISVTEKYQDKKQKVLLDKLFGICREKKVPQNVKDWLASKINSPPVEILNELEAYKSDLGISSISEFEKTVDLLARDEYLKNKVRDTIYNSRDLIIFAENKYFADNFIPWASRRVRDVLAQKNISNTVPADGIKRVFFADETIKDWISKAKNDGDLKVLFDYFGLPKYIPDYTKVEAELKALQERIGANPQGVELDNLTQDVEAFVSKVLSLNFETVYGVPTGLNVINTLMRKFSEKLQQRKQGRVFRINADFDFLSQAPVEVGDVLKLKGIPIINEEFGNAFADKNESTAVTVQKGAGDELVIIGYFEGKETEFKDTLRRVFTAINAKLQEIKFNGQPIVYNVLSKGTELSWKPSISAGVSSVSDLTGQEQIIHEAELLDAKAEAAVQYSKDEGRAGISFFEDIPEKPVELEQASFEPYVSDDLFKRIPFAREIMTKDAALVGQKFAEMNREEIHSRVKQMSIEELEKLVAEVPKNEMDSLFYKAAFLELEGRKAKDLLCLMRHTAPYAILIPLTEDQMLVERSKHQGVVQSTARVIEKKYYASIRVFFYTKGDIGALKEAREKALATDAFKKDENALLLAYVTNDMKQADIEAFKQLNKVAGVVKEEIAEGQRLDEVLHVVIGAGLIDYVRTGRSEMAEKVKALLSIMVEDADSIKALSLENLLKGLVLLKIKKIDYGEIDDWKEAQDAVLKAL